MVGWYICDPTSVTRVAWPHLKNFRNYFKMFLSISPCKEGKKKQVETVLLGKNRLWIGHFCLKLKESLSLWIWVNIKCIKIVSMKIRWAQAHKGCQRSFTNSFPNRGIGLDHDTECPPRSPDLNPQDFFLWGYLKVRVYITHRASIQDLENRIRAEMRL